MIAARIIIKGITSQEGEGRDRAEVGGIAACKVICVWVGGVVECAVRAGSAGSKASIVELRVASACCGGG